MSEYSWIKPNWYQEGFQKGLTIGLQQSLYNLVLRQVKKRFRVLNKSTENRVRALSVEKVEELAMALLDFKDTDDLQMWLNRVSQNN